MARMPQEPPPDPGSPACKDHDFTLDPARFIRDCSPRSPFRAPDWRWRLATATARGWPPRRGWSDDWVRSALKFLKQRTGGRGRPSPIAKTISDALEIQRGAYDPLRRELEIRILGGQTFERIDSRCGFGPGIAEAYGRMFFDFGDKLHCRDYIVFTIDPGRTLESGEASRETIAKLLAHDWGADGADLLLESLQACPGLSASPLEQAIETAVKAFSLPTTGREAGRTIAVHLLDAELRQRAESRRTPPCGRTSGLEQGIFRDLLDRMTMATVDPCAKQTSEAGPLSPVPEPADRVVPRFEPVRYAG